MAWCAGMVTNKSFLEFYVRLVSEISASTFSQTLRLSDFAPPSGAFSIEVLSNLTRRPNDLDIFSMKIKRTEKTLSCLTQTGGSFSVRLIFIEFAALS